jgi:hypothetical protein
MKRRVAITLTFTADLDMVEGWGHQPEDWVNLIKSELHRNSHYETEVDVQSVQVGRYTYESDKGWVRPTKFAPHSTRLPPQEKNNG